MQPEFVIYCAQIFNGPMCSLQCRLTRQFPPVNTYAVHLKPIAKLSSVPSTPVDPKKQPSFTQEQPHLDAYERALRQRKQEVSVLFHILSSNLCLK